MPSQITKYLTPAMLACMLACSGCSNDNAPETENAKVTGKQVVQVSIKLPSRAPQAPQRGVVRKLESSNAYQAVQDLKVYFFRCVNADGEGPYVPYNIKPDVTYLDFSEHFAKEYIWDDDEQGQHQKYTARGSDVPMLPKGWYKLLAKADEGKVDGELQYQNYSFEAQSERLDNNYMIVNYETSPWTSEVFIGFHGGEERAEIYSKDANCATPSKYAAPIHILEDGDPLYADIELRRAVTGVLLYVENIPQRMKDDAGVLTDVYHMALVPTTYTTKWALYDFCYMDIFNDNKINDPKAKLTGVKPIMQYSFEAMYNTDGTLKDTSNDGCFANFSTVAAATGLPTVTAEHPHAVRLGQFIPPIQSEEVSSMNYYGYEVPTLYLIFYDKSQNPICKRPIYMIDPLNPANTAETQYFLYANHIYTIGNLHYKSDGVTPDIDRPIDLRNYNDDTYIVVQGNWQDDVTINF